MKELDERRLHELEVDPATATAEEIRSLCDEALRWRPARDFIFESLKAIYINGKECAEKTLVLQLVTDIARTCLRRMKEAHSLRSKELPTGDG